MWTYLLLLLFQVDTSFYDISIAVSVLIIEAESTPEGVRQAKRLQTLGWYISAAADG